MGSRYLPRSLADHALELAGKVPVLTVTGPRQSGKTTLLQQTFPDYAYFNLERPDIRQLVVDDPRLFLRDAGDRVIFDEAQRVPDLFSYVQALSDEHPGRRFILSGSQNFLLLDRISQSLAGRTAVLHLLPFSTAELERSGRLADDIDEVLFRGGYPRVHAEDRDPTEFYPNYVMTYLERDVRTLRAVEDLDSFQRLLELCAGRIGQPVNLSSLAGDVGMAVNTVKAWLSVLETSFVIFRLQPHHRNFNKRLTKTPKLYFHDTGLAASLLGIEGPGQLRTHYLRGGLFESFVLSEFLKCSWNRGKRPHIWFWQDRSGHEIDCIVERGQDLVPVEIKSSTTANPIFLRNLDFWYDLTSTKEKNGFVVYAGDDSYRRTSGTLLSWKHLDRIPGI